MRRAWRIVGQAVAPRFFDTGRTRAAARRPALRDAVAGFGNLTWILTRILAPSKRSTNHSIGTVCRVRRVWCVPTPRGLHTLRIVASAYCFPNFRMTAWRWSRSRHVQRCVESKGDRGRQSSVLASLVAKLQGMCCSPRGRSPAPKTGIRRITVS